MKKLALLAVLLAAIAVWWTAAAPRPEIGVPQSLTIDRRTGDAIAAVDRSGAFAGALTHFPSTVPSFDDATVVEGGGAALVTATDGRIWRVDLASHAAEPFADPPLMAYGIDTAAGDPNHVYFCASRSYADARPDERVGLYRLALDTREIVPIVLDVPATNLLDEHPVVYADADPRAPEARSGATGRTRPLIVCDNLDVSADGRRIYFSEPFDYAGASVGDALDEAIALAPNGRLWRHDLDTGATRLIAEGYHFVNGVLVDLHPGAAREDSVLVTQTSLFRLTRFHVAGPNAGRAEIVLDGLTGLDDGMDRDAEGRIWLSMFTHRSALLTWVHEHAWVKPLFMRVPARLLMALPQRTGVVVVTPDGRTPLYAAMYRGDALASIASSIPTPGGIYLANEQLGANEREAHALVRLAWPRELGTATRF
jgi:sugar lactone lactonase YvrE